MVNFDALLNPAVQQAFGEPSVYKRRTQLGNEDWPTNSEFAIDVVSDFSEETQIRTNGAFEAWVRESDFEGTPPAKGDFLTISDVTYKVVDVRPATTLPAVAGGRYLEIRKAAAE